MDATTVFHRLAELGFDAPGHDLASATKAYQEFHGLKVDGSPGPITQRSLEMPRFCKYPDRMNFGAEAVKFPRLEITYANAQAIPGFTLEQTQSITDLACSEISKLSALKLMRGDASAVIWLQVGRIDGRNGTLAWSELARTPRTNQLYDNAEPWKRGVGLVAIPYPAIDALYVMTHELFHAVGLEHAPGSTHLLSPIYSPQNWIGDWERNEMVKRYGPPTSVPPPTAPPVPPAATAITIRSGQSVTITAA